MRLLLIWIVNTVTLFVLPRLLDTVQVDSFTTALIAALVLGLVAAERIAASRQAQH